jgi:hypothetical protein
MRQSKAGPLGWPFEPEDVLRVSFAMPIPFARMDRLSSFAWDGLGQNPRYSEAEAAEPAGGQQKGTGTGMQRLHLKCEKCRPAMCGCRFYSNPFSGSAAKRVVLGLSRSTVSEWQMKCLERPARFAVALPTASRSMGCFRMQQRRMIEELGHLQPMLMHLDRTFARDLPPVNSTRDN